MAADEGLSIPGLGAISGAAKSIGGAVGDLFESGGIGQQFLVWGILGQLANALLAPALAEITQAAFSVAPDLVNSPGQLADMVARGLLSDGSGKNNAAKNGVGGESFEELVTAAGGAPSLGELMALLQRGIIARGAATGTDISFDGALANAGLRQAWIDHVAQLAVQIPSVAEVMNAWLEGQITEDEARTRYIAAGGDPTWFQTSYNANGEAPTPVQALEMLNRGLIPEDGTGPDSISYNQAFLEGPWRDKWLAPFLGLKDYLPPPRTVTAMYREGSIPHDKAADALSKQGLTADWVAAYLTSASSAKTATSKELSKTDILDLYTNSLIDAATALPMLEAVGYDATESGYLLKLADVRKAASNLTSAVNRIRSQFIAGRLDATAATAALVSLGVPGTQSGPLIAAWTIEHAASAPTLSAAEIASALDYAVITQDVAQARLEAMGYTPHDAWIILSTRAHAALPGEPAE